MSNDTQNNLSVNRNYKAGLFTHLFGDPKNELELYNAFAPEPYPPDTLVTDLTLSDVLFMDRVNDLSFSIGNKLVVFFEHSSTINENIPLRYLMYSGRVYEKLIDNATLYSERRTDIPAPEFYVLYNGTAPFPEKAIYRLSDSFVKASPTNNTSLELIVTAYNVNRGYNDDIVSRSENLHGYVTLVSTVRDYERGGMERPKAVKQAVKDCIASGVLGEYLKSNASEVNNMLIQDWNWDTAKSVWQKEAKEEGRKEGREEGLKDGLKEGVFTGKKLVAKRMFENGYSDEQVASVTESTLDEVKALRKDLSLVNEDMPVYNRGS